MILLTGQDLSAQEISNTSRVDLAWTIAQSLQEGKPVIATSNSDVQEPLINSHAYTVTGYDANTDSVTLRNPWGYNGIPAGETKDGVTANGGGFITISMDEFQQKFNFLRTSTEQAAVA
jgi:hypothetical protein